MKDFRQPEKTFCVAGPPQPRWNYYLDPLTRTKYIEAAELIGQGKYFILHAPRQTGKTTLLLALMHHLNAQGHYRCLYANFEPGQAARNNVDEAIRAILNSISNNARAFLNDLWFDQRSMELFAEKGQTALTSLLSEWTRRDPERPAVLLIDEIDSLVGDTLISVLRQLREGYARRPSDFPQSVILCGLRDVKDYRIHRADGEIITGGSAFNIKSKSLRLGDFEPRHIEELYLLHTEATGQAFAPEVFSKVWGLTHGQPWLVNALAHEATWEMKDNRDRTRVITGEIIEEAAENLIRSRTTHLDQLADKLQEPRVHRVIAPIMGGESVEEDFKPDDVEYCIDLGLIRRESNGALHISNKIYQEILPRELSFGPQMGISQETSWYVMPSGRLDMQKLLSAFQEFFRENAESWVERLQYKEAGPQLLLQAFLQRIVNGGGQILREYGLGRMRTDLFVRWPWKGEVQKVVLELKILHKSLDATLKAGLEQTNEYADKCAADECHLIVFDRRPEAPWDDKIYVREERFGNRKITVWGC